MTIWMQNKKGTHDLFIHVSPDDEILEENRHLCNVKLVNTGKGEFRVKIFDIQVYFKGEVR